MPEKGLTTFRGKPPFDDPCAYQWRNECSPYLGLMIGLPRPATAVAGCFVVGFGERLVSLGDEKKLLTPLFTGRPRSIAVPPRFGSIVVSGHSRNSCAAATAIKVAIRL
jgi:hypothetical protein